MIVLDTNVISEIFRPKPDAGVIEWLSALTGDVAITSVTLAELLACVRTLPAGTRRSSLQAAVETAVLPYRRAETILPFDDLAADRYAEILAVRRAAGRAIATADAQIAAICRARNASLATRNTKDFLGTGIALVDPWTS